MGIKVQELRCGNFIYHDSLMKRNDIFKITPRFFSSLAGGQSYEDQADASKQLDEYWQPIPLTEQWLLDLGFWKVEENVYSIDTVVSPLRFCLWKDNFLWRFGFDGITMHCFKMDYVHQLQNLYYALTGEELELK